MFKNLMCVFLFLATFFSTQNLHSEEKQTYKKINALRLKRWIDEEKNILIFDSRTPEYDDGVRIPLATLLPCTSTDAEILSAIPSKDSCVVIYCTSVECIASKILADSLIRLGYNRVYKYSGGLSDWEDKNYPIIKSE